MDQPSVDVMTHQTNARYILEGIRENTVHYRCKYCRTHVYITLDQRPEAAHNGECPGNSFQRYNQKGN